MNTKTAIILANLGSVDVERLVAAHNYCMMEIRNNPDDEIFNFDQLCEIISYMKPEDVLMRTFYGYHDNGLDDDYKESFNPRAEWFRFNGYANLCSMWDHYAEKMAIDGILDSIDENTDENHLDAILEILGLEDRVPEEEDDDDE